MVFHLDLKYLHVKITNPFAGRKNKQIIAWFVHDIRHKYHSWYFKIVSSFTRLTALEITYNNFEISLVVFMPNIEEQGMAQWWERSPPTNVRALASHQCGPGSNPSFDSMCGLSLLLVLSLAPRGFSPGSLVFPSPQKPTFPNSSSTRNQVGEEPPCGCATSKSLFI